MDNRLIREALNFDMNKSWIEHERLHPLLNPEQRLIYEQVIHSVHNQRVASSGGRTAHSRFIIPLELLENSTCGIKQNIHLAELMQILPVIPKGKRPDVVQACINRSELWKHCNIFTLTRMPAKAKDGEDKPTWIQIPKQFLIKSSSSPIENIVAETYPNFIERQYDDEYLKELAILTLRNDDVDEINNCMFNKLAEKSVTYNSADEIYKASTESLDQQQLYPTKFLNTLNFSGMPPHALCLKKELPIMLLRNVNPHKGTMQWNSVDHYSTRQIRNSCKNTYWISCGLQRAYTQNHNNIKPIKMALCFEKRQYPVKPCYAMTINKSQG
ncbi:ATP-dependent DNA helicase PIF1-like protein [Tanacetum coccineum]|uniref:ATP-dependent DNA helicase n=1 Tax=Tanacetum coccineum TaxID=301880 RepID=A0ABQ5HLS6_9ASTR